MGQNDFGFNMSLISPRTELYCFYNDMIMDFSSQNYSTIITENAPFSVTISLKVTRANTPASQADSEKNGILVFVALPMVVNSQNIYDPFAAAPYYLRNWICVYQNGR